MTEKAEPDFYRVPEHAVKQVLDFMVDLEAYIRSEQAHKRVLITPEHRQVQSEILEAARLIRRDLTRCNKFN